MILIRFQCYENNKNIHENYLREYLILSNNARAKVKHLHSEHYSSTTTLDHWFFVIDN